MQKMRLGVDQKNLPAQAGCPEVAAELGNAQLSVICYSSGVICLIELYLRKKPV
jgi:hypothetical protein